MSDIDRIRRCISVLPDIAYQKIVTEALDRIEANWLDFDTMPKGWGFDSMSWNYAELEIILVRADWQARPVDSGVFAIASGPSVASAFAAACARAREAT